ncbi:hypothetical protein BABINDRAFT_162146 [Babjeviella inositovora NRRL Y-12698]|uniref:Uncharacterized protein n=1 Tax=Babjeviella inositovora NRRL Y-12698 TaxID=984486 RepID=A0A1E3QN09_9ASCO|nr:uncharacterized protein BABINDRAFT_162146 [Babjeviella inositovora NRRL Y-12698]ODQ79075.1 hypothetical protein BABINDRAFT_162146 [Babjeviella inositovora NRRL Y-12698]
MAVQKDASLDKPIDVSKKAVIASSVLTPDLASAVLNLNIDRFNQIKSKANRYLFWQLKVWVAAVTVTLALVSVAGVGQNYLDNIRYSDASYIFQVEFFTIFFTFCFVISGCFVALSFLSFSLGEHATSLEKNHKHVFGTDLEKFAQLPLNTKDRDTLKQIAKGQDTFVISYRDTPIATISLQPVQRGDTLKLRAGAYVVKVTGLGVRKIYIPSGMYSDLLEWAILHARKMYEANGKKDTAAFLIVDNVYNFDTALRDELTSLNFAPVAEMASYLNGTFKFCGIVNETWAIEVANKEGVESAEGFDSQTLSRRILETSEGVRRRAQK